MGAKKNATKEIEKARELIRQAGDVTYFSFNHDEQVAITKEEQGGNGNAWPNAIKARRAEMLSNADYALRAAIGILKGE